MSWHVVPGNIHNYSSPPPPHYPSPSMEYFTGLEPLPWPLSETVQLSSMSNTTKALYDSTRFAQRRSALPEVKIHEIKALYDSSRFARCRSALPEVKIREIMIHEPSSFLKHGNQLQLIRTIRVDLTTFLTHPTLSRGTLSFKSCANRLLACWIDSRENDSCWFDRIDSNQQHFQPTLKPLISYIFLRKMDFRHESISG